MRSFVNKGGKRYGPVRNRGLCKRVREQIAETQEARAEKAALYAIPVGTRCHVRKEGESQWARHTTRKEVVCRGYVWRNDFCWGFRFAGYEIKVKTGLFSKSPA